MDLPGTTYLLALATISITFVGFSSIMVIFRQAQGASLSEYEIVLVRLFAVSGLIVTIFSLLPPLIGLFGIPPAWLWRIASLALAAVMIWRGISFRRRQNRFQRTRRIDSLYITYSAAVLGLLANTIGIVFEPGVALYALAATWYLVIAILAFILSIELFLHPPRKDQGQGGVAPK
jgi:hypothetical protein